MTDLRVVGADQLSALGKQLQAAGAKDLKRELLKEFHRAARDSGIRSELKKSATNTLPGRGGLGLWVAQSKFILKARTMGRNVGVSIKASRANKSGRGADLERIDRGRIKHPTHGHAPWVLQDVRPGWFRTPLEGPAADEMRRRCLAAIARISALLEQRGGRSAA